MRYIHADHREFKAHLHELVDAVLALDPDAPESVDVVAARALEGASVLDNQGFALTLGFRELYRVHAPSISHQALVRELRKLIAADNGSRAHRLINAIEDDGLTSFGVWLILSGFAVALAAVVTLTWWGVS